MPEYFDTERFFVAILHAFLWKSVCHISSDEMNLLPFKLSNSDSELSDIGVNCGLLGCTLFTLRLKQLLLKTVSNGRTFIDTYMGFTSAIKL